MRLNLIILAMLCVLIPRELRAEQTEKLPDGYTVVYLDTIRDAKPDKDGNIPGVIRPTQDYYAVFLEGVYIDKEPSFFTKNNFAITVDLSTEGQSLAIPLYSADRKIGGRLGVSHYGLINSIPANGKPLKVGVTIARRDADDPVKQTIDFLNGSENNSLLKTYAASAIPYMSLVGGIAKQLYGMFSSAGDANPMLQHLPVTLSPFDGTTYDKHTLRDTTIVIYKTNKSLDTSLFSIDGNGDIHYNKKPFTDVRWVAFRIQRFAKRQDYAGREWQRRFEQAVAAAISGKQKNDYAQADRLLGESDVLLASDQDYTAKDRQELQTEHQRAIAALKHSVQTASDTSEAESALTFSFVMPKMLGGQVTATGSEITVAPGSMTAARVIAPGRLLEALEMRKSKG